MKKYKYILNNLDCANCANKIEMELQKEEELKNVIVNFNTLTLTFETDLENPYEMVLKIVNSIEPDVLLSREQKKQNNYSIIRFIIGILLLAISLIKGGFIGEIFLVLSYIVLLSRTFIKAIKILIKNKSVNENALITISCIGAYLVGEKMEGLMVIILYEIGKILEEKAVSKSRRSIEELMNIKPEYANLKTLNEIKRVDPNDIKVGDIIVIKNGEKIPLDGIIVSGETSLNTASLTGEAKEIFVKKDDSVLSGSINTGNVIEVKTTSLFKNSTVSRILDLVLNATNKKAKTENFVSKYAGVYTVIVMLFSLVSFVIFTLFTDFTLKESIYKSLIFLVISCPCAIAISVPLSYFSAIGVSSKRGILVKGSNYLDNLNNIDEIIFDKTGTITTGNFNIGEIVSLNSKYSKMDILNIISRGEKYSNHPLAKTIINKYKSSDEVDDIKEIPGKGLSYKYDNDIYKIGNSSLVDYNISLEDTVIFAKKNDEVIGYITLKDEIKKSSFEAICKLKKMNIKVGMFTGDEEVYAREVSTKLNLDYYNSKMLPEDKFKMLERIKQNKKVAFVGDGINDAPVLTLADIGISMGNVGSESAIEASDIVIANDDLNKIIEVFKISKFTKHIIKENLIFALTTKVAILLLSMFGIAAMWEAIFADVGVTLIAILNTLRILKR